MVTQTFGEALFVPDSEGIKQLKSPNSMKKRFIISTKPPKEYLQAKKVDKDETNSPQKVKDGDEGAWGKELTSLKLGTTRDKVRHIFHTILIPTYVVSRLFTVC